MADENHANRIADELGIKIKQVAAAAELLEDGCTGPLYCPLPQGGHRFPGRSSHNKYPRPSRTTYGARQAARRCLEIP